MREVESLISFAREKKQSPFIANWPPRVTDAPEGDKAGRKGKLTQKLVKKRGGGTESK